MTTNQNPTGTNCQCGCPLAAGHQYCSETCRHEAEATSPHDHGHDDDRAAKCEHGEYRDAPCDDCDTADLAAHLAPRPGEEFEPCPYCGQPTFETYSEARAVMHGNGYRRQHVAARRVGDGAPLGPVECEPGRLGWGA